MRAIVTCEQRCNGAFAIHDDRTAAERMSKHRDQQNGIEARVDNRSACGERVGRRTGGGGDDDPIGTMGADELLIDKNLKPIRYEWPSLSESHR